MFEERYGRLEKPLSMLVEYGKIMGNNFNKLYVFVFIFITIVRVKFSYLKTLRPSWLENIKFKKLLKY